MSLFRASQHDWNVLSEIAGEHSRNLARWGAQDHPSVLLKFPDGQDMTQECLPDFYGIVPEDKAKASCERRFAHGIGAWADIGIEEMAEAVCAPDDEHRRAELVQVAAVCVAWIQAIDRKAAGRALDSVSMDPPPMPAAAVVPCPDCGCDAVLFECVACSANNYPPPQSVADAWEFMRTDTVFPAEVYA